MPLTPCLACGTPSTGPRCAAHARPGSTARGYSSTWQRISAATIAAQPWCARCGATTDLTTDHIVAKARGGLNDPANLQVLCRRCNSAKRDRGTATTRHSRKKFSD